MSRALGLLAAVALLAGWAAVAAPSVQASTAELARTAQSSSPAPSADSGTSSFSIRLVDIPAAAANDRRAWRYIIDFLHPGTVIHRRVAVENLNSRPAIVRVYADAAAIEHGMFVGDPGQARSDLIGWTSVAKPVLTIAPGATVTDMVTIRVPSSASPGERYGVIWAQEESTLQQARHFAVTEVNRVGVRIYLAIGPGGLPPTNFAITSVSGQRAANGAPVIVAGVRNTGKRAIDLTGDLKLSDGPGGDFAGPFPFTTGLTLAPGQSGTMRAMLSTTTPAGLWHVTLTLQSDTTSRQAGAILQLGSPQLSGMVLSGNVILGAGVVGALLVVASWLLGSRLRWRAG